MKYFETKYSITFFDAWSTLFQFNGQLNSKAKKISLGWYSLLNNQKSVFEVVLLNGLKMCNNYTKT